MSGAPSAANGPVHRALGWRCGVCGAEVGIETPLAWRCPNSTDEDRHHVLHLVSDGAQVLADGAADTFRAHDRDLAWSAYAAAHGITRAERDALVTSVEVEVRRSAGVGFAPTPLRRSQGISSALGFTTSGGVWVKDETGAVGGSQKARHLMTILLHLLAAERLGHLHGRPPLAIASCGNAALAASVLARAVRWPLDVYVPTWMEDGYAHHLDRNGARVHRCERRPDDPPGDPAMTRFRAAVAGGAVPFTVQGPENALCLDGGRTIGWEAGEQLAAQRRRLDRVFVQVGGGAFAACLGRGLEETSVLPALHAVQAEGCAPLERAWRRARGADEVAARWNDLMTPWDSPASSADGILDDETYDWLAVFDVMRRGHGSPVVVSEGAIIDAHRLALDDGYQVSPTGAAGLAGLLTARDDVDHDACVLVVMSGIAR